MSNRQLAYATDAEPAMHESGIEYMEGMWESVTIERSAAGQPGILIIMERRDGDLMEDQMCVTVKDGTEFLRPVFEWLHGGDLPKAEREARCPYSHQLDRCSKCGWTRPMSDRRIEAAQRAAEAYAERHRDEDGVTNDEGGQMLQLVDIIERLKTGGRSIPAPTAATVAAFKKAWHDADAKGMTGARVEAGLIAALQELFGG